MNDDRYATKNTRVVLGFRSVARYWRNHYMPVINGLEARLLQATARIKQLEEQATDGRDK